MHWQRFTARLLLARALRLPGSSSVSKGLDDLLKDRKKECKKEAAFKETGKGIKTVYFFKDSLSWPLPPEMAFMRHLRGP